MFTWTTILFLAILSLSFVGLSLVINWATNDDEDYTL